jgi:hypothetical protein
VHGVGQSSAQLDSTRLSSNTTGSKQVDEHDLARGGPGVIVSLILTLTASELELEHLRLFQKIGAGLIAGGVI